MWATQKNPGKIFIMGEGLFIYLYKKNMIILSILLIASIILNIMTMVYYTGVMKNEYKCIYGQPCLRYDEIETKEVMKRVTKLLLEHMEKERKNKELASKFWNDIKSEKVQ